QCVSIVRAQRVVGPLRLNCSMQPWLGQLCSSSSAPSCSISAARLLQSPIITVGQ
ncbi:hypothetical protein GBA52_015133, partial [Prunus armeniaca]